MGTCGAAMGSPMKGPLGALAFLVSALVGCQEGGMSSTAVDSGGWGWISIEAPSGPLTTAGDTVLVTGSAFIRSESGGATADVTWWNVTTGASGPGSSHFTYEWQCFLWACGWWETTHAWSASVPLAMGDNVIFVEARTNNYNWARKQLAVVRVVDSTPPVVAILAPAPGSTVAAEPIVLAGTAWDDVALATVTATNLTTGATFVADGTAAWTVMMSLLPGANTIVVTALDTAGLSATDTIEVSLAP